jgi:hypothetical protein
MTMSPTDEIRAIRRELAARFENDLSRIVADLQRQQRESGREYLTLPKRPPRPQLAANPAADQVTGGGASSNNGPMNPS